MKKMIKRIGVIGVAVVLMLGAFGVMGCVARTRPPRGYAYGRSQPIIHVEESRISVNANFHIQFPELNSDLVDLSKNNTHRFFLYNEKLHYIRVPTIYINPPIWSNGQEFSVYRQESDSQNSIHLGDFVSANCRRSDRNTLRSHWLDDNYIFYHIIDHRNFRHFGMYRWETTTFYKHSFFKFNLHTGTNTELDRETFFSALQPFYEEATGRGVMLNPYFRVR